MAALNSAGRAFSGSKAGTGIGKPQDIRGFWTTLLGVWNCSPHVEFNAEPKFGADRNFDQRAGREIRSKILLKLGLAGPYFTRICHEADKFDSFRVGSKGGQSISEV
ncbi:hypothetical protein GCM10020218_100920 [Dactylosporangium vinaceum]